MMSAGILESELGGVMTGASGGIGRALLETWRNEDARLYLVGRHGAEALRDLLAADRESRAFQNAKVFAADLALDGAAQGLAERILAIAPWTLGPRGRNRQGRAVPSRPRRVFRQRANDRSQRRLQRKMKNLGELSH